MPLIPTPKQTQDSGLRTQDSALLMKDWRDIRSEVLQRDGRICQVCGKEHSGQVHHIIPRSQGGSNDLSNLITLCGRCHMVISPVPQWLITKLWKIPLEEIPTASEAVQKRIREWGLGNGEWGLGNGD